MTNYKLLTSSLFLFVLFSSSFAQKKWFKDDFNDNSNPWPISSDEYIDTKIENGHYVVNLHDSRNYYHWKCVNIYMDFNKDFRFSSRMRINKIDKTAGAGIYLTEKDDRKTFFMINPETNLMWIGSQTASNQWKGYTVNPKTYDWVKCKNINKLGEYNELVIERKGNMINFILNDVTQLSLNVNDYLPRLQKYIGVAVFAKGTVEYDYIEFDQDNWDDVLLPDAKLLEAKQLSKAINTEGDELKPVLSADNKMLFFSRLCHKDNTEGLVCDGGGGDVYVSEYKDGQWTESVGLGPNVNDKNHNTCASISPDGNTILIVGKYNNDITENLYFVNRTKDGWSKPKKLNIKNFYTNSKVTNYFLAPDSRTLILCIDRKEGKGYADFYVSFRNEDDTWTEPKHTGDMINTKNTDFSPFLAADGKTLYFATWDLPGYGAADMYVTKRLDDTWQKWTKPKNMGPSINNEYFNAYYYISTDGQTIMYSSDKNSFGRADIFMSDLPKELKPEPVMIIKGQVYNSETKEKISANINYYSLKDNVKLGQTTSAPETGYYSIVLPVKQDIGFLAQAEKFISVSDNVLANDSSGNITIERDLFLTPIKEGITVRLNNIFFDFDKFDLKPESYNELDRLVAVLENNSTMIIEIRGHTDNKGDDAYNMNLSDNRAKSVYNYLLSKKINPQRVSYKGYGETIPVASNENDEGRELNRRVEFYVVKY